MRIKTSAFTRPYPGKKAKAKRRVKKKAVPWREARKRLGLPERPIVVKQQPIYAIEYLRDWEDAVWANEHHSFDLPHSARFCVHPDCYVARRSLVELTWGRADG